MGRAIAAVVAGYLLWTVLWLGFNAGAQSLFPDTIGASQPITSVGVLLTYLAYTVVISVAAGFVCAAIRTKNPAKAVQVLAGLLLVSGVVAEVSYWDATPVWYHLVFLALLVPSTLFGGRLKGGATSG